MRDAGLGWNRFSWVFQQPNELFDRLDLANSTEILTEFNRLRDKVEQPHQNCRFALGLQFPDIWEGGSRNGLIKSNFFLTSNFDKSQNFFLSAKGMKWTDAYLLSLGTTSKLKHSSFDMRIVGSAFYKLHADSLLGFNLAVSDCLDLKRLVVDIKPAFIHSSEHFAFQASAESIGVDNKLSLLFLKKHDQTSKRLAPSIKLNAAADLSRREVVCGVGASFHKFYSLERVGFNLEKNAMTEEARFGIFVDNDLLCTRLHLHKVSKDSLSLGMELSLRGVGRFFKGMNTASLMFGVSSNRLNDVFLGLNFNYN